MAYVTRFASVVFIVHIMMPPGWSADSSWPMFRHDAKHTGCTPYTGPATSTFAWSFPTDQGIASSPTIGEDGTIYVGVGWYFAYTRFADSCLLALYPDGSLKWRFYAQKGIFASPALAPDGTIYVSSLGGNLYALEDSVNYARLRWSTHLEYDYFFLMSSPVVGADGTIYLGSPSFYFYAVDPAGSVDWKYRTSWCIISSPAIGDDGTVYVGSKDHHVYAFDPVQKQKLWAAPTGIFYDGHLVDSSPAIGSDGTVYVGSDQFGAAGKSPVDIDTSFWAFNPDGTRKWAVATGSGVESSPAIGPDGTIYFGSYDGYLYAVADAGDSAIIRWKFQTGGTIDGSATVDGDGTIYFGSRDSTLYALYPDGTVKWTYRAGGGFESSPTIDGNGMLYIGCFDGRLYAFGTGAPDVGVSAINMPSAVVPDSSYFPEVAVRNFRAAPLSFSVACHIERVGVPEYADTLAVHQLAGGQSRRLPFKPWRAAGAAGVEYEISASSILAGDDNTDNDALTMPVKVIAHSSGVLDNTEGTAVSRQLSLLQNYPNPFNSSTGIEFAISVPSFILLKVYDLRGREVRELAAGQYVAGRHTVVWDGRDRHDRPLASGIYFYRLQTGNFVDTRKMVLLK